MVRGRHSNYVYGNACFSLSLSLSPSLSLHYRIESLFPQEQEILENKAWLSEYLSAVASICYTDLQSVRDKGQKCFPPSYGIMDFFVRQYHKSLVKVVSQIRRIFNYCTFRIILPKTVL